MFRTKSILWLTFAAFCVTTGSCDVFYNKTGDTVKMRCAGKSSMNEVEWRLNNILLLSKDKTGRQRKANLDTSNRARIDGTTLKISDLKILDTGKYTCNSDNHMLYVASAHANPTVVMYSSETKLSCDITGDFQKIFQWISPKSENSQSKEVTVKAVTSDHAGLWICKIKNEQQKILVEINVIVSVVGPLITSEKVMISEGGTAVLPCSLSSSTGVSITGGSWTRNNSLGVHLVTLMRTNGIVQWNKTNVNTDKVGFSDKELKENFNVTLKKVKPADSGVYVCSLMFNNGKSLSANFMLNVSKKDGSAPDIDSVGSKVSYMYKTLWGLQGWIWIAILVSFGVLIAVIVTFIGLMCCRNKRRKRKMKNSMRQPRNYCMCDRTRRQPGKSPGKRERPPPLPRHQYSSLNE